MPDLHVDGSWSDQGIIMSDLHVDGSAGEKES